MATPRKCYTPSPILDSDPIDLSTVVDAGWSVGGALVLVMCDPADPAFDEVDHTRVLHGSTAHAVWSEYQAGRAGQD